MTNKTTYIDSPYIKSETIEKREYQVNLADIAVSESTLIALPTGTGKTVIAMLSAGARLDEVEKHGRILMLAPTKPLVQQHVDSFREFFDVPDHEVKMFTGDTRPEKRERLWKEPATVVVATPQVIENDLIASRISLEDVVYTIFDECHRATGDYAYTYIADRYWEQSENSLVTGMSASPASDEEEIVKVCDNLGISNIEVLTEDDESLKKYMSETEIMTEKVELSHPFGEIRDILKDVYSEVLTELKDLGVLDTRSVSKVSKSMLHNYARGKANSLIDEEPEKGYRATSLVAEARRLREALNVTESFSLEELDRKLSEWSQEASSGDSKAVKRLMRREEIREVKRLVSNSDDPHPKMKAARSYVIGTHARGGQSIVFTKSRKMASTLEDFLTNDKVEAHRFVGQSDTSFDEGMTQDEQADVLHRFRNGDIDVLVATSVAEEGLDIPTVDLVLFYDTVASSIRSIQRRGRTGRESKGKVVVVMSKGTRDEGLYYASKKRESKMHEDLKSLQDLEESIESKLSKDSQSSLDEFNEQVEVEVPSEEDIHKETEETTEAEFDENDKTVVYADNRETKSSVARELSKMDDIELRLEQLEVGDYIVSDRCALERKTSTDLRDTIVEGDRDLFGQLSDLRSAYDRPLIIFEDNIEDFFSMGIHPNAVRAVMASIVLGMDTSTLFSRSSEETAEYIATLARREQEERDKDIDMHGSKSTKTVTEQQIYVVSSIADIGPVTARNLLQNFGSIRGVMTADRGALMEVDNIGKNTADKILDILTAEYGED